MLGMKSYSDSLSGKRVLVTGHTGFKGAWLSLWLQQLGAEITGIALPANTQPSLFELLGLQGQMESHYCDIRDAEKLNKLVQETQPEFVFHLAAQPLVRAGYRDPLGTLETNIMGTANLLDTLRGVDSIRVALMITTDKVYGNLAQPYPFRETDALGGQDPYSASKAACEILIASYRDSYLAARGVALASARAGNVIGGGDWAEDRLIPDAIRAWQTDKALEIRRPQAIRPWQHVLEPLHGYLTLAAKLWHQPELAGSYNFGPPTHEAASVRQVIELARKAYGKGDVHYSTGEDGPRETHHLALENAKARQTLGLSPKWSLAQAITRTLAWYQAQHAGADARQLCLAEIAEYVTQS
ncbi:MAG: CDP-glucose 4,6-dehydratase [Gammaproteobacteria bacterium SHHR-1]